MTRINSSFVRRQTEYEKTISSSEMPANAYLVSQIIITMLMVIGRCNSFVGRTLILLGTRQKTDLGEEASELVMLHIFFSSIAKERVEESPTVTVSITRILWHSRR